MACIKANSVDMTEILPISPNTLSYKIHLLGVGGWVGEVCSCYWQFDIDGEKPQEKQILRR